MNTIKTHLDLKDAVAVAELKQSHQLQSLKQQLEISLESLKPLNLVKSVISDFTGSTNLKSGFISSTLSLGAGLLIKNLAFGPTHNPIKKVLGTLLQLGVSTLVSKNENGLIAGVKKLVSGVFEKSNR